MIGARHHTTCSAERCTATIAWGWFCKPHWSSLPDPLRLAVLAAYNAARKGHCNAPRDEQEQLNRAYGVAFRDCQDYLRTAPRTDAGAMSTIGFNGAGQTVRYANGRRL